MDFNSSKSISASVSTKQLDMNPPDPNAQPQFRGAASAESRLDVPDK